jgi:hypothetical protein
MKSLAVSFVLLIPTFHPVAHAQNVTVTADSTPDESISQAYMALDSKCRNLVRAHGDPAEMTAVCKSVADEAEKFPAKSHFITRRGAYVFYTSALVQARRPQDALLVGDKAVAIVLLGHDDPSGSSAAYSIRGHAKVLAGDLTGADQDLERAEVFERDGLNSPAGQELKTQYSKVLENLLRFHAQVLVALGKQDAAKIKLDQAKKLSSN